MTNTNGGAGLGNAVSAELELRRRRRNNQNLIAPTDWETWCTRLFPKYFSREFAPHHRDFWEWVESIQPKVKPKTFVAVWGRGDAKSTSAETACVRLGSKGVRKYGLYISSTQIKADGHVMTIGSMLESKPYANYYHKMSRRAVNQYGTSVGWKHNRLVTSTKFAIDAFGLDSGLRGAKIEEARPDFIILDDVDEKFDSPATVLKKIQVITETILPSGSDDCAILFIQNLIHSDSIASRIADGRGDFLKNRIFGGVIPAVRDLVTEYDSIQDRYIVVSGSPTWQVRTLEDAQAKIDDWGLSAYKREALHDVKRRDGPWSAVNFIHVDYNDLPIFDDVAVWVDPAISATEDSNSQGISIGGRTSDKKLVGLKWWEGVTSPQQAIEWAIEWGYEWGASHVGIETDQGGDTWESVYREAVKKVVIKLTDKWLLEKTEEDKITPDFSTLLPKFTHDKASRVRKRAGLSQGSKMERNSQMLTDYEKGKVKHMIGTHTSIEEALWRVPHAPWDLSDSWWWTWFDLLYDVKERFGAR